jgi:type VI secretion system secreted protein Hcp
MALNAYLKLKGQTQGDIKGSVTQKGKQGSILVTGAIHEVLSPRDPASGLPTGKRLHKPFVVHKPVDRSTPLLYAALVNNENLTLWELRFWRPKSSGSYGVGVEQNHYTVKLTNAAIASIRFVMPSTLDPSNAGIPEYEEVSFTYQKIEWTWTDGGITAMDDWEAPVA